MSLIIESKTVAQVIDLVVGFIASKAGLNAPKTQDVFREAFRLFFNSWINRGCPIKPIRDSKLFWFTVDGFRKKSEFRSLIKWFISLAKLWISLRYRDIFCVGARDNDWVNQFYDYRAARIDFSGKPTFIVKRSEPLRAALRKHLLESGLLQINVESLCISLPEDLLEGCLFQLGLFLKMIPAQTGRDICSEDLIENINSACLVAVALQRGWQFTYKEHALPMLIFKDHFSVEYARVASRIILTEDYSEYISDEDIRKKCLYSAKTRPCRFRFDPNGSPVLCLPFISGMADGMHWTGDSGFVRDLRYDARHFSEVLRAVSFVNRGGEALIKHHSCRSKGTSLENFPAETLAGAGVKEVVFVGWTQGFFECKDAGIPTRIILTRPLSSLTDSGRRYIEEFQRKGTITLLF